MQKNFFVIKTLVWFRIRTGPGFSNSLDPDPYSVNPDSKHCLLKHLNSVNCTFLYTVYTVQALLEENPAKHPIIILKDVPFLHLTAILEFMYAGEVNVAQGCVAFSSFSMMILLIYLFTCNFSDNTDTGSAYIPAVLGIRIRTFLGFEDPDPDPLVRGMDPDPSITNQN
jgi:hypothetical protein